MYILIEKQLLILTLIWGMPKALSILAHVVIIISQRGCSGLGLSFLCVIISACTR